MVKDSLIFQAKKFLSQVATRVKPYGEYLQDLALVNSEEREILGYCYGYLQLFGSEGKFAAFLERAIPAIRKIGMAKLRRTELTDLGFFVGERGGEQITFGSEDGAKEQEEGEIR